MAKAPDNRDALLHEAAQHVGYEWQTLAEYAGELDKIEGSRTIEQTALLEASFLHARCLIGFLCGDYQGRWHKDDMKPVDFLRDPWLLPDPEDRELRGYLPIINEQLAHLSWRRLDPEPIWLPGTFLAHLLDWNMRLFVGELQRQDAPLLSWFDTVAKRSASALPPRRQWGSTPAGPAPVRKA